LRASFFDLCCGNVGKSPSTRFALGKELSQWLFMKDKTFEDQSEKIRSLLSSPEFTIVINHASRGLEVEVPKR